tara:strand:+ start:1948 stop:2166 length:219 start_codon:yes stop_codon:yes gene_type:complete
MKNPKERMQAMAIKMSKIAEEMERIADENFSSSHPQMHEIMKDERDDIMKQVNACDDVSFKINKIVNHWFIK